MFEARFIIPHLKRARCSDQQLLPLTVLPSDGAAVHSLESKHPRCLQYVTIIFLILVVSTIMPRACIYRAHRLVCSKLLPHNLVA